MELQGCTPPVGHPAIPTVVAAVLTLALPAPAASQFTTFLGFESTDASPLHWRADAGRQFFLPSSPLEVQVGAYGGRAPSEDDELVLGGTLDLRIRFPVPVLHPFLFGGGDLGLGSRARVGVGIEIWTTPVDLFAEVAMVWPDDRAPSMRVGISR